MNWMITTQMQTPQQSAATLRAHADEVAANYEIIVMDRDGNPVPVDAFLDELVPVPPSAAARSAAIVALSAGLAMLMAGAVVAYLAMGSITP